ncbi:hypothetical protein KP509_05G078100 [Ceratopteris richardii]|nr:hypothetical protein KP509_05G078100 [Ceratopteris richardii]
MQNSTKQANDQNIDCNVQVSQTSGFLMSGAITSPAPCHHYRTALSQELTSGISGYTQSSYMDRLDCPGASHSKALQLDDPKGGGINLTGASTVGAAKHMQMKADRSEEADSGPSDAVQVHPAATITDEQSARTLKKPRLVWTSQLHKRFVDAVAQLGIKNAVPKTIMQLMNVDGLTRENVASHLQKYRLYLKRSQDTSTNEGLSSSDQLFASIPVPPSLTPSSHFLVQQHAHHLEHRFAPVQDRPMPSITGSYANYFPPHISSSLTSAPNTNVKTASSSVSSIPSVNVGAAFSTVGRVPHSSMVIGNEHVRESCFQPSISQPSHILTLFPTSGS